MTDLSALGIPRGHLNKLAERNIRTVEDMLSLLPRRYNDCSKLTGLLPEDRLSCICLRVEGVTSYPKGPGRRSNLVTLKGKVVPTGERLNLHWFNQIWMYQKAAALLQREVITAGYASYDPEYNNYTIQNPLLFTANREQGMRIYPVYPKIPGISNDWRDKTMEMVTGSEAALREVLPEDVVRQNGLVSMAEAYRFLHHPQTMQEVERGRERILFNDLLSFSLRNEYASRACSVTSPFVIRSLKLYDELLENLPYDLTPDQDTAVEQLIQLGESGKRINALLQGEVGSGKTLVAQLAAACFAGSGYQVAVLAPTRILAKQHYEDFSRMFEPYGIHVVYLDSSLRKKEAEALREEILFGKAKIIIGTHSLFGSGVEYCDLALVVTDEEHRFGVCQRSALVEKAAEGVHVLSMSATPIPRTLASVMYGEQLQLLNIATMPAGRKPILTGKARSREAIYKYLKKEIAAGHQAYVVCPMIEKNDMLDGVKSVDEVFEEYSAALPDLRMEKLTGRTDKEKADDIIGRFKEGQVDILIATTVVEVGVNVPNATVIVISNAERFGLSGLHQLRGRVGRGVSQGVCVLECGNLTEAAQQRMDVMCRTNSGFEIAEEDLRLRGPGELLGTQQSGYNRDLGLALAYPALYARTREVAAELLDRGTDCCSMTASLEDMPVFDN